MALDKYFLSLGFNTQEATSKLNKFENKLEGVDRKARGKSKNRKGAAVSGGFSLATKLPQLAIGAAVTGFFASVISESKEFETVQSRVAAGLQATTEQAKQLKKQAREIGANTQFSAQEVSNAQLVLAKNGVKLNDILGGTVEATLNLSGALKTDLPSAADLVTDVMLQFNKSAADAEHITNLLAGAAFNSKAGFNDLRLGFAAAGGAAGALGVNFEDFTTALAGTISLFASGSDAGTGFKTFLTRLKPTSKDARKEIKRLGLEFFDSNGKMKSMAKISGELNKAFKGLTEEQKIQTASLIFGQDAMRTAFGLAKLSEEGFVDLKESINGVNAEELSIKSLGKMERAQRELSSAFSELKLSIGDSGLADFITSLIELTTKLVRKIGDVFAYFNQPISDFQMKGLDKLQPFIDKEFILRKNLESTRSAGDDKAIRDATLRLEKNLEIQKNIKEFRGLNQKNEITFNIDGAQSPQAVSDQIGRDLAGYFVPAGAIA